MANDYWKIQAQLFDSLNFGSDSFVGVSAMARLILGLCLCLAAHARNDLTECLRAGKSIEQCRKELSDQGRPPPREVIEEAAREKFDEARRPPGNIGADLENCTDSRESCREQAREKLEKEAGLKREERFMSCILVWVELDVGK